MIEAHVKLVPLGILAGILEFIPVAGWMTAAATIVTAGSSLTRTGHGCLPYSQFGEF